MRRTLPLSCIIVPPCDEASNPAVVTDKWIRREPKRIYVFSGHPLVRFAVIQLLPDNGYEIESATSSTVHLLKPDDGILLIDGSSVEEWPLFIYEWHMRGGRSLLICPEPPSPEEEIRFIRLGAAGVVSFATIQDELARAVDSALNDHLWASSSALELLVKRAAHCPPSSDGTFTPREEQMLTFLIQGFSNKGIAGALNISERTVKFHVTNVLRKLSLQNRRDLRKGH
jgi:DNA-binding NarL/FixJ family response regulator